MTTPSRPNESQRPSQGGVLSPRQLTVREFLGAHSGLRGAVNGGLAKLQGLRHGAGTPQRSVQNFSRQVPKVAHALATRLASQRSPFLGGEPVPARVFGMPEGLLPVMIWQTESMLRRCFENAGTADTSWLTMMGKFESTPGSLTGYSVRFDCVPHFASVCYLFLQEAVIQGFEQLPSHTAENTVQLSGWVEQFRSDLQQRFADAATLAGEPVNTVSAFYDYNLPGEVSNVPRQVASVSGSE